jgi:hypothetical protein
MTSDLDAIVASYLASNGGDADAALRQALRDALADLLELERRTRQAERLVSRGYVRGARTRPPAGAEDTLAEPEAGHVPSGRFAGDGARDIEDGR